MFTKTRANFVMLYCRNNVILWRFNRINNHTHVNSTWRAVKFAIYLLGSSLFWGRRCSSRGSFSLSRTDGHARASCGKLARSDAHGIPGNRRAPSVPGNGFPFCLHQKHTHTGLWSLEEDRRCCLLWRLGMRLGVLWRTGPNWGALPHRTALFYLL